MKDIIYVDNAATTPVIKPVLDAMIPYFCEIYGNPSTDNLYEMGAAAKQGLNEARETVARAIGAKPNEIYFTSCGSESDNWAIKGTALKFARQDKKHLITSAVEHHAVLHTMKALEKQGFTVTYLPVDSEGFVAAEDLERAITPQTCLVSIMMANNEIGTIEPIRELAAIAHRHGVWFHTDAVQAAGAIPIDVETLGVDMLSLSAHKFNGPKGVGALYIKRGISPDNFMDGGAQEARHRAGTENVAGIVGLATALDIAIKSLPEKMKDEAALRDKLFAHVAGMENASVNGPKDLTKRLPNNVNISFPGAESESVLLFLNMKGICASSGSACASEELDPSHVLLSIGLSHAVANCTLRISFGPQNTKEEAAIVCEALDEAVHEVRRRSAWTV